MGKAKYINSRKFSNMNKLIKKIGTDKLLHFFAGVIVGLLGLHFFGSVIGILAPAIFIGTLKETYDFFTKKGTPELLDVIATVVGGAMVLLLLI